MVDELGLPASLILGKLIYWNKNKENQLNGYFFKTFEKLKQETGVGESAQKSAVKILVNKQLIFPVEYDHRHRRMFKVNMDVVISFCASVTSNRPKARKPPIRSVDYQQTEKGQEGFIRKESQDSSQTRAP